MTLSSLLFRAAVTIVLLAQVLLSRCQVLMLDMDRVDSGVMVDQSGFGNDAEVHGIPNFVENRFGVSCRALEFDGSLFLSIPDAVSINFQREFTVAGN